MGLKTRLLLAMSLIAGLLIGASWAVTRTTTSYLVDQVDAQLVRLIGQGPLDSQRLPRADSGSLTSTKTPALNTTTLYVGVFEGQTLTTRVSPTGLSDVAAQPALERQDAQALTESSVPVTVNATSGNERYRVMVRTTQDDQLVVVGANLSGVDDSISRLVSVELFSSIAVLIVLMFITWWVLRLGVGPIRRMTQTATAIADGDATAGEFGIRVAAAPAGTEAGELGRALNVMLDRVDAALEQSTQSNQRLQQFVADASHELRTPIATIRGYTELYSMGGLEDREALDAAIDRVHTEAQRMSTLVEDLLTLARLNQGPSTEFEDVKVHEVAQAVVSDLAVSHPDRVIECSLEPSTVRARPGEMYQVLANLLNNAFEHNPPTTTAWVACRAHKDQVLLRVADSGPGIDPETARHAFERFYRADKSRSRASGGSGLGLSIVAGIVDALNGTVRIESGQVQDDADIPEHFDGTVVTISLPRA